MEPSRVFSAVYSEDLLTAGKPDRQTVISLILRSHSDFSETMWIDCRHDEVVDVLNELLSNMINNNDARAMAFDYAILTAAGNPLSDRQRSDLQAAMMHPSLQDMDGYLRLREREMAEGSAVVCGVVYNMRRHWVHLSTETPFQQWVAEVAEEVETIRIAAHRAHALVNQFYNDQVYCYHLDMVADAAFRYGHAVCESQQDVLPLLFGAYFHDSIEDAHLTYNDVKKMAIDYMDEQQAILASEIVYALTNDKGRNRAERGGDRYYQGIRTTPYAPFIKLCDRLANTSFSFNIQPSSKPGMKDKYRAEMPHFMESISVENDDPRFSIPKGMVDEIFRIIG